MREDGTMMRTPELMKLAKEWDIKLLPCGICRITVDAMKSW